MARFKPGDRKLPHSGRRPGTVNKRTTEIRATLYAAAHEIGGLERLIAWIKEDPQNERLFWSSMYLRLLPVKIEGTGEHGELELNLNVKIDPADLERRLEERGIPTAFFGVDKPVLVEPELEAQIKKTNGGTPP